MLKVVLVDRSLRMQEALRLLLSTVGGLEIVGSAVDAAGARQLLEEVEADVVVIDDDASDGTRESGLLRGLAGSACGPDVVVMAAPGPDERREVLLAAGAQAVFCKAGDGLQLANWMRGRVASARRLPVSTRQPADGMPGLRD